MDKIINGRIQHKHDSEANWIKATGFSPKQGELIVYDADESSIYPRLKIGDGTKNVNDLPFVAAADNSHKHIIADITDLQTKLDEINVNLDDKADLELVRIEDTVTKPGTIDVDCCASAIEHDLVVTLSSETYATQLANITVNLVGDSGNQTATSDENGIVSGLRSSPSFTITLVSNIENFDASLVNITCTYLVDLKKIVCNYILHVEDKLEEELGEIDNELPDVTLLDDGKILTVVDGKWEATDVFTVEDTDVLPKQELIFSEGELFYEAHVNKLNLEKGKTYIVSWGNKEYACTATNFFLTIDSIETEYLGLGNLIALEAGMDTGEPFLYYCGVDNDTSLFITIDSSETRFVRVYEPTDNEITWDEIGDKPFGEVTSKTIYNESLQISSSPVNNPEAYGLVDGFKYSVTINNTIYVRTAIKKNGEVLLGNLSLRDSSATNTSEPFLFVDDKASSRLYVSEPGTYSFYIVSMEGNVKTIDRKYIAGPSEFNLSDMGLPVIPMNGSSVQVNYDTTELCSALDKDTVKILFKVNTGTETAISGVVNAMKIDNVYSCGFIGTISGSPKLVNINVTSTSISASIVSLV